MNFNFVKRWREHRAERKQRKRLGELSGVFGSMEKLFKSGLLAWNQKERRLYIAEPIAVVMIGQGWERWRNFLNNVYLYQMNLLLQEQWNSYVISEQNKAVKKRRQEVVILPKSEAERIRRAVRDNIQPDAVKLPPIETFEFFVIADVVDDAARKAISYVGEYDPDTEALVMAPWEDVRVAVEQAKKNAATS